MRNCSHETAQGRHAVVTGASTGIGWATVKVLVEHSFHVFGGVRKSADAARLSADFGDSFTPLHFDVTDEPAVREAAEQVAATIGSRNLFGLVNNAGIYIGGPLAHQSLDEFRRVTEVNLFGPLVVTQAFLPLLGTDTQRGGPPGRVVNISSITGQMGTPFQGAYVASKCALEGYSQCLRRELMLYGIDVIVVAPGAVVTPIWDKAKAAVDTRYAATDYAPILREFRESAYSRQHNGLPADRIGQVVWRALIARRPRTRYTPLPKWQLRHWIKSKLLPARLLDRHLAPNLGRRLPRVLR